MLPVMWVLMQSSTQSEAAALKQKTSMALGADGHQMLSAHNM